MTIGKNQVNHKRFIMTEVNQTIKVDFAIEIVSLFSQNKDTINIDTKAIIKLIK